MIWSLLIGYAIGGIPSADAVGRARGIDLHSRGSGNPGTANALRVGGRGMAAAVLALDLLKGATAALVGRRLAGDAAGMAAAVAAIYAQVASPWLRFKGGKGIAVTGGATLVLWPYGAAVVLPIIAAGAATFGSAAGGLIGILAFGGASVAWASASWPAAWGIDPDDTLVWFAIWVAVLTAPKFITALIDRARSASGR